MRSRLKDSGVGDMIQVHMSVLMFAQDQYTRALFVLMGLASAYSVTASSVAWLVYLVLVVVGQILIEAVYLHIWEGKSARVRRRLNASGVGDVQVRMSVLMFAQPEYIRELLVAMELITVYPVTVSSVELLGFPSVSLAPSFLVRSTSTKPLSQLSPSQPPRALPSVVESCRLVDE